MKLLVGIVILFLLSISWNCAAEQTDKPELVLPVTTETTWADHTDLEIIAPANAAGEDLEQTLPQGLEATSSIESEFRPTKRPKRPHGNKHPVAMEHKQEHHNSGMTLPGSWPYFTMSSQMPNPSPCSYPQPIFYPMPMYTPYFYPVPMISSEKLSPVNTLQMDSAESTESGEEINADLLRKGYFWNNRNGTKWDNKNRTETAKPNKRFPIRNWVEHKLNKKNKTEVPPNDPPPR